MNILAQIHKLFTVLLREENRKSIHDYLRQLYYASLSSQKYGVESVSIDKIVNFNNIGIALNNFGTANGNVTHMELLYICSIIKSRLKPGANFLEIGTFDGNTIMNASLNIPESSKCYTIDLTPNPVSSSLTTHSEGDKNLVLSPQKEMSKHFGIKSIEQFYSDSTKFDFSKLEFSGAFIDGGHHYSAVKADTENILNYIQRPGFILWHDYYGYNDVATLIHEISDKYRIVRIESTNLCFLDIH